MDPANGVYFPLQPYQTRIIRLHGDNGHPSSPLVCELLVADILHQSIEGLGLRGQHRDRLVEFHALSYTWDGQQSSEVITCNYQPFPITRNLSDALLTLRSSGQEDCFLWADALCINQSDDTEKAVQVRNMLSIYQKASKVIAWLGNEEDCVGEIVKAQHKRAFDVENFCKGLRYVYTRPWFKRIWVQQEIFAARRLTLRCGAHHFRWSELLSKPRHLFNITHLKPYRRAYYGALKSKGTGSSELLPIKVAAAFDTIDQLNHLYIQHIGSFMRFSQPKTPNLDFIETLLDTGGLDATNQKDYIYGILGMTQFAAKPMSLEAWRIARVSEYFIPIDYSATYASILTAVSWTLLMKGGIAILAKFQAEGSVANDTEWHDLPSWVIDWRVVSRCFRRRYPRNLEGYREEDFQIKIENAWDTFVPAETKPDSGEWQWMETMRKRTKQVGVPPSHQQFCDDNRDLTLPLAKLIVRGFICGPPLYIKDRAIWKTNDSGEDERLWNLGFLGRKNSEDIILVHLTDFMGPGYAGLTADHFKENRTHCSASGGLWLLEPVGQDEFRLVACLPRTVDDSWPIYRGWKWKEDPEEFLGFRLSRGEYWMRIYQMGDTPCWVPLAPERLEDMRRFVIV